MKKGETQSYQQIYTEMTTLQLVHITYLVPFLKPPLIYINLLNFQLDWHDIKLEQCWHIVQVYIIVRNTKKDGQWTALNK